MKILSTLPFTPLAFTTLLTSTLLLSTLLAGPLRAEDVRLELHLEGDAEATGHLFFSYRMPAEQVDAHAIVAAGSGTGHGGELLGAFGMRQAGDDSTIGAIDADALAELAHSEGGDAGSLMATVNAEQLMAVKAILEAAPNEPLDHGNDTAFENVIYRVLNELPVKAPFRGAFSAGDPYQLVHDIVRINNK